MKYFEDFTSSGNSFGERVGQPDEFDAAMGRIALGFSYLEDTTRNVIVLLSGAHPEIGHIMVAELSFRQKLDVLGSMVRQRVHSSFAASNDPGGEDYVDELLSLCHRAEELRNAYCTQATRVANAPSCRRKRGTDLGFSASTLIADCSSMWPITSYTARNSRVYPFSWRSLTA